jgi:hypothetical protein
VVRGDLVSIQGRRGTVLDASVSLLRLEKDQRSEEELIIYLFERAVLTLWGEQRLLLNIYWGYMLVAVVECLFFR